MNNLYNYSVLFIISLLCFSCTNRPDPNDFEVIDRVVSDSVPRTTISAFPEIKISKNNNIIYCISMQLAWNKLKEYLGGDILSNENSRTIDFLNKSNFTNDNLNESSFLAKAGLFDKNTNSEIEKELNQKFSEPPNLIIDVPENSLYSIAYMHKKLDFEAYFEREYATQLNFNNEQKVDYFYHTFLKENLNDNSIIINDYINQNNFMIEIKSSNSTDHIILAKVPPKRTLLETYKYVNKRMSRNKINKPNSLDVIGIPYISFHIIKNYPEICGLINNENIKNQEIGFAQQMIDFDLNEKGITLTSYASFLKELSDSPAKQLFFDKPFMIILKEKDAKSPYFLMWVNNTELMVK